MKLYFVANFPYMGGGGIWSRFGESAGFLLGEDDYILLSAFYLLSKGEIFRRPKVTSSILEELGQKYPGFPPLNVIMDFGKAFYKHLEGTQISRNKEFFIEVEKYAERTLCLAEIWKPAYFTSIDVPTIKPPHVKVAGERREPLVSDAEMALKLNHEIIQLYRNLLSRRKWYGGLLISLQGDPRKPQTYQEFLEKTEWVERSSGYSVGSLTEIKINPVWGQTTINKRTIQFTEVCMAVKNGLEALSLEKEKAHLHMMGSGAFMKLPVIAHAFYDFKNLTITADLQSPVKRASDMRYLCLEKGAYENLQDDKVSDTCNCKMCEKIKEEPYDGNISAFLNSPEGMRLISPRSSLTVRKREVLLQHNILVHKMVSEKMNRAKDKMEIIEESEEMFKDSPKLQLGLKQAFKVLSGARYKIDSFI